jgi:hypothetical protein
MKQPQRLLSLPEFAKRVGIFYSLAYSAYQSGDLVPDFVSNKQALFDERNLPETVNGLRRRLSADEFDELLTRIRGDAFSDAARKSESAAINDALRVTAATRITPASRANW